MIILETANCGIVRLVVVNYIPKREQKSLDALRMNSELRFVLLVCYRSPAMITKNDSTKFLKVSCSSTKSFNGMSFCFS